MWPLRRRRFRPARSSSTGLAFRKIYVNTPLPDSCFDANGNPLATFPINRIQTSKYTLLNFLPKNLFEQFRKVANFYFLALVVIQCLPGINDTKPEYTALPICCVVIISATKDAFEDWKRHKMDKHLNKSVTHTLKNWENVMALEKRRGLFSAIFHSIVIPFKYLKRLFGKKNKILPAEITLDEIIPDNESVNESFIKRWQGVFWENLKVGDFILLKNNDPIPADCVILATSLPDGVCFLETKNLDGETNLKMRRACQLNTDPGLNQLESCLSKVFRIEAEFPHPNMYLFRGLVTVFKATPNDKLQNIDQAPVESTSPLSIDNVLLRGCVLRNTAFCLCLTVATGKDTKIMLNSGATPSKMSCIERKMNPQIVMNFVVVFILCAACAIGGGVFDDYFVQLSPAFLNSTFNPNAPTGAKYAFLTLVMALVIFQNLVPISLYLSIEFVKTFQAYFIHADLDMYCPIQDQPTIPRRWNLSDDLGQVEYIFSDKTGTLTRNVMEFRKCSIMGEVYGEGNALQMNSEWAENKGTKEKVSNRKADIKETMDEEMDRLFKNPYRSKNLSFIDFKIVSHLQEHNQKSSKIKEFFAILALCHSVIVEKPHPDSPQKIVYKSQSPDEEALVSTARDMGFVFLNKIKDKQVVNILGKEESYKLLNTLEFNSSRKRMSVIVETNDGIILLLCKGADNVIYQRLAKNSDSAISSTTMKHLESFASEGLRTLCIASRAIERDEYELWNEKYQAANISLVNREQALEEVAEQIEHSLNLVGATAIEDKLQEGVPECIETLSRAGIKLWVLTGDKAETAINIGFSCNLLTKDMVLLLINGSNETETKDQLQSSIEKIAYGSLQNKDNNNTVSTAFGLVIEGEALKFALRPATEELFHQLCMQCTSVICCRSSPLQKALVVRMVKKKLQCMCLAIGDGANDVSMIQEADVGVGISGLEGQQAAMSSDYAISQFRFLKKLLLVHGRLSYFRISNMIFNFFYKNFVWTLAIFWYQIWCGFSGESFYDFTFVMFYNLVFTLLPVLVIGVLDKDVDAETSIMVPQLYQVGNQGMLYTTRRFWMYILDGFYQSVICFFIPNYAMMDVVLSSGLVGGKFHLSTMVAFCVVMTVNLGVGFDLKNWSSFGAFFMFISVFVLFAYFPVYSMFSFSDLQGLQNILFGLSFLLILVITVFLALLPRFIFKYFQEVVYPDDSTIIRERKKLKLELSQTHFKPPHFSSKVETSKLSRFTFGKKNEIGSIEDSSAQLASSKLPEEESKRLSFSTTNIVPKPGTTFPITDLEEILYPAQK